MDILRNHFISADREYKEGDVFVFKQTFTAKDIKKADLNITALGMYEVLINNKKVGDQIFAPGFTYYPRRLLYQSYNISDLLVEGENELIVFLGQGWYAGRFLVENKTQIYGDIPAIAWRIDIDGKEIYSDNEVSELSSPYEYAGIYDGEVYNANHKYVVVNKAMKFDGFVPDKLEKTLVEVKVQEEVKIHQINEYEDYTIIDFGQNFAGFIEINPEFLEDENITIRHGEVLNPDGSLYTRNLRKAKATIKYKAGNNKEVYRPRFTYMGFRYIELSGVKYHAGLIKALAIYTDMKRTGYFDCGNDLVNRLFLNQLWGQKSNYVEVPTDCPQRDERMGYTGDGQVFARTGAYNYHTLDFWQNFFEDTKLSQMDNSEGYIPATIPAAGPTDIGFISMLGWGNAITIIPNILYEMYGDTSILFRQYESMKTFVEAEIRQMKGHNLWLGASLGDWLAYGKDVKFTAENNNPISNSFIVQDLKVLVKVAEMLNKEADIKRYSAQLKATKAAYINMFVEDDGTVSNDYQSAYIMALAYVIDEKELRDKVLAKFVENVKSNGMETGFFATAFLLPLLIEAKEYTLAYDILLNDKLPSWMYQIKRGATTNWERWDAIKEDGTINEDVISDDNMVSFNHYAFGSVGQFYYEYILGIKPLKPGFEKILIKPIIDKRLEYANGIYESVVGEIKVYWKYEGDLVNFEISVPTDAIIHLPNDEVHEVKAGIYKYNMEEKNEK